MKKGSRNENGRGSICLTKDKAFRAYFSGPLGRTSKRFKTKDAAVSWLAEQRSSVDKNQYIEPSAITVGQWVQHYIDNAEVRDKTRVRYSESAAKMSEIRDIPLQKLSPLHLQAFFNALKIGPCSRLKVYRLLSATLKNALSFGLIIRNPLTAVKAPKYRPGRMAIFSEREVSLMLAATKDNLRLHTVILLAFTSGARLGEILGLKVNCVCAKYIIIENNLQQIGQRYYDSPPKTDAGFRDIALQPEVIAALLKMFRPGCEYVFNTSAGTPYTPNNLEKDFTRLLEQLHITGKRFHCFRHTHASMLLAAGVPVLDVSVRLGHSKPSHTLDLYGHVLYGYGERSAMVTANILAKVQSAPIKVL